MPNISSSLKLFSTLLGAILLCGCSSGIPFHQFTKSEWYQQQTTLAQGTQGSQAILCGKVSSIKGDTITLSPFINLTDRTQSDKSPSIPLNFAGKDTSTLAVGKLISVRVLAVPGQSDQVQDYQHLTQPSNLPPLSQEFYDRIVYTALKHGWELNDHAQELANGMLLILAHGEPQTGKFYTKSATGEYSDTRTQTEEGRLFPRNSFIVILWDMTYFPYEFAPKQNTPGFQEYMKFHDKTLFFMRYGYDMKQEDLRYMTNDPEAWMLKPLRLEKVKKTVTLATNKIRATRLQAEFEKAGIPGKWEADEYGCLVFYSNCREYEVDADNHKIMGPRSTGFIFSLAPAQKTPAEMPKYAHANECDCPNFYYWKMWQTPGYLEMTKNGKPATCPWTFEFGEKLTNHKDVLEKILTTLRILPSHFFAEKLEK